jgi:hypothetical protein
MAGSIEPPKDLKVLSRQLRVDLVWSGAESSAAYEIQRASNPEGPFETLTNEFPTLPVFSGFIGQAGKDYYYRVRSVQSGLKEQPAVRSKWSEVHKGSPQPFNADDLLTEVQEAGFRYFYDFGHPVSGLAREGLLRDPDLCAIGASGMGFFNLIIGVERGFITRQQAIERALKMLHFLSEKADRFHGAFPHMINGATGKAIQFSEFDDGADLVETAFLMQGIILLREYFAEPGVEETEIRLLANMLWRTVEWAWFALERDADAHLMWHWSPNHGWNNRLAINGFNEAQIAYVLALASPTHAIAPKFYWKGWKTASRYGSQRTQFGIPLALDHDLGPPLFFTHYSYLSLDPRQISYQGRTYFDHFSDFCRVQVLYSDARRSDFKGYGSLWGITASYGPDGYRAFAPGLRDNGTIAPTAALSSMPYAPKESRACLAEMYKKHGKELWGPFGFYDAFNLTRNWVARDYLGIDLGPIAPMIENHRTGFCWKTFMKAPEIVSVTKILAQAPPVAPAAMQPRVNSNL